MGKKKMVMRRLAALLAASLVLTSSAFSSLAAVLDEDVKKFSADAKAELKLVVSGGETVEAGKTLSLQVAATATTSDANPASKSVADKTVKYMNESITWRSSDEKVATVENGVVTGVAAGTVTITAEVTELSVSGTKVITVTKTGTEEKPSGAEEKPSGAEEKPSGAEEKPSGAEEKPSGAEEKPSGAEEKPSPVEVPVAKLTTNPTVLTFVVNETKVVKAVLTSENDPNGLIKEADIKWDVIDGDDVIEISGTAAAERTVKAIGVGKAEIVVRIAGEGYEAVEFVCGVTVTAPETLKKNDAAVKEALDKADLKGLEVDAENPVDVSEITEELDPVEVQEAVEKAAVEQAQEINDSVKEVVVAADQTEVSEHLTDVLGEEEIEDGVKAADLTVRVVASGKPQVKAKVVGVDVEGKPIVKFVVTKVTVNVDLVVTQENGKETVVSLAGKNTKDITIPVMIPETVDSNAWWATITHRPASGRATTWKAPVKEGGNGRYVDVVSSHFSPFDIAFSVEEPDLPTRDELNSGNNNNSNPGGYSGGGRSSGGSKPASNNTIAGTLAGQWQMNETGWWFRLDDGSYAVNSWQYVAYNGVARWYRFDANGYICKGWFTDADGHRYYLNPVSDGLMGSMLTGWQQIDGIWYYFNTASDGTQGALLVNTTTPDGYNVDANGQWIQ